MGTETPTIVTIPVRCAPKKVPCPKCGEPGRRKRILPPRRVRTVAYLEITCGEYQARCDCCTTFRSSPDDVLPRAAYDNKVRDRPDSIVKWRENVVVFSEECPLFFLFSRFGALVLEPFPQRNRLIYVPRSRALDVRARWPFNEMQAEVAELADALGSGPSGLTMPVEVQVLSSAYSKRTYVERRESFCFYGHLLFRQFAARRGGLRAVSQASEPPIGLPIRRPARSAFCLAIRASVRTAPT